MAHIEQEFPQFVVVFSGKRKSGKDYIAELLQSRFDPSKCITLRLSAPLKKQYALEHNLDWQRLLDSSSYKEMYREDMITWGEEKRSRDPSYFCNLIGEQGRNYPMWIISDARRKTDIEYFKRRFGDKVKTVRIEASEKIRQSRGWVFTPGVDDAESECGLDNGVQFDIIIENNGDSDKLETVLSKLYADVCDRL